MRPDWLFGAIPMTRRYPNGTITVEHAADVVYVNDDLLDQADRTVLERRDDVMVIRANNGTFRYRLVELLAGGYWHAERLYD